MAQVLGFRRPSDTLAAINETGETAMRIPLLACLLLLVASPATAEPIQPGAVEVQDGDT
jgi:hypothetical protein